MAVSCAGLENQRQNERTITFHLHLLNSRKTTTYDVRNPGPRLKQAHKCGGDKAVNGISTFPLAYWIPNGRRLSAKLPYSLVQNDAVFIMKVLWYVITKSETCCGLNCQSYFQSNPVLYLVRIQILFDFL